MSQDQHNDEAHWTEIEEEAPQEGEVPDVPDQAEDCNEGAPGEEQGEDCNEGSPAEEQAEDCNEGAPAEELAEDCNEGAPAEELAEDCNEGAPAEEQAEGAADGPDQCQDLEGEEKPELPCEETQQGEQFTEEVVSVEALETQEHGAPAPEEAYEGECAEDFAQEFHCLQYYSGDSEAQVVPQQAFEEEAPQEYPKETDNNYDAPQHAHEVVGPGSAHARSMPAPHAAAAPPSAIVKPRTRHVKSVARWEAVGYDPRDGSDDEFELSTCMAPVYEDEGEEGNEDASVFKHGEPDFKGEIMSCFDEPNLLYRIIDPKTKTWAFYNDSLQYEMHVQFIFGKHSKLQPLENTTLRQNEEGQYVMEVVVYPTETEMFSQGTVNGFTSKLRAVPLTVDYHNARRRITEELVNNETAAIQQVTNSDNAEDVLQACIDSGIPFVDPEFPPCQASLEAGASKPFKPFAWARPQACVPEEMASQVRLFRASVRPACVDAGDLGDSWVICSVASVSEDPARLMGMFRHPEGKAAAQREHAVGAYRVTFNKNGWWRSVVVDSYLPVSGGKLKYAKSATDPAEIWPAILEKAYAKLHGSYGRICSGDPLHALQDMTGFSTMRFDESLTDDKASDQLFSDLVHGIAAGYTVICSTPGRGPHDKDQELCEMYAQVGLVTGCAYTILEAKYIESKELRMVKVRNVWGHSVEWSGNWGNDDTKWDANPDIAEECNFQKAADGMFWMSWKDARKYFNGGGVCFTHQAAYDYRMNCVFTEGVPSAVLEIEVQSPTCFTFVISQDDKRCQVNASEYKPVMISIAEPVEGEMYKVVMNSSANGARPTSDKWTFLQARDVSLIHELDAGKYIVVPRIMPSDDPVEPVPYVLGMICSKEVGNGDVSVKFKRLDAGNRVFENFPKFEPELMEVEQPVQYQKRAPGEAFPMTQMGEELM
ncbi:calpain-like cysteine peptidase [Leishmania mexicana MHOM/GT/2001/U1103]|uniref:Calpain-like cysteine peptidase n=1 Tax=Leishmania mexicana (strain MHOM/GT/2001/U1103) TaxID=929439 RepID=E9AUQ7_LEIMU|nr:calpain-like cysteine peptidase [Leishmania mexicana MHOM/GT/2001/U1103]CBZ26687.1 calpain-like cysteine peptidase [Leishmania mexicana MHOM/GT/2001/U1103]